MKFKRELTDLEISKNHPRLKAMQSEIEAAGAKVLIRVWEDIEIAKEDIVPSSDGFCPQCERQVVEVEWDGAGDFHFAGVACTKCHEVLEFVGFGPLNWGDVFGDGS